MHGSLVDPRLVSKFQMPKVRKKPRTHGCSGHSRASQSLCPWQACESRRLNKTCFKLYKLGNIALAPAYETLGACTKASSLASKRSDQYKTRPLDMARLPKVGTISPFGLRGVLPYLLLQMRTREYTGLLKENTGKDAAEDHTSLVGPAGLGVRGRPNGRVLRKVFSADFRHIAQSAMFRALRDFPQNSV